jgi:hypothetical protein
MTDLLFRVVVFEVPLGGGQSHDHEVPMKSLMNFEVPMKFLFKNEVPCEVPMNSEVAMFPLKS